MAEDTDAIKAELKNFIIGHYLLGSEKAKLSDDDSFLDRGIIDSIGVIELASFIQNNYRIKIGVAEIVPANMDTINNLTSFIVKKIRPK